MRAGSEECKVCDMLFQGETSSLCRVVGRTKPSECRGQGRGGMWMLQLRVAEAQRVLVAGSFDGFCSEITVVGLGGQVVGTASNNLKQVMRLRSPEE